MLNSTCESNRHFCLDNSSKQSDIVKKLLQFLCQLIHPIIILALAATNDYLLLHINPVLGKLLCKRGL